MGSKRWFMIRRVRPFWPKAPSGAVEALYATGYFLFAERQLTHARAVFRGMIHLAPHDERGWLALGACYEAQHPDWALRLYEAARQSTAGAPRCDLARARILRSRGRLSEARQALSEAAQGAQRVRDADLQAVIAREWVKYMKGVPLSVPPISDTY
jgi:tetratricopeptide (TPR) repeat protein